MPSESSLFVLEQNIDIEIGKLINARLMCSAATSLLWRNVGIQTLVSSDQVVYRDEYFAWEKFYFKGIPWGISS